MMRKKIIPPITSVYVTEFMSNFLFILQNEHPAGWPVLAAEISLEKDYFLYFGKQLTPSMLYHSAKTWNDVIKALFSKNSVRIVTRDGNNFWKCFKGRTKTEMHTLIKHGPDYEHLKNHQSIGISSYADSTKKDDIPLAIETKNAPMNPETSTSTSTLLPPDFPKYYRIPTICTAVSQEIGQRKNVAESETMRTNHRTKQLTPNQRPSLETSKTTGVDGYDKPYRRFHANSDDEDSQPVTKNKIFLKDFKQSAPDPRLSRSNICSTSTVTTYRVNYLPVTTSGSISCENTDTVPNSERQIPNSQKNKTESNQCNQPERDNQRGQDLNISTSRPYDASDEESGVGRQQQSMPYSNGSSNRGYRRGRPGRPGRPHYQRRSYPMSVRPSAFCHYHRYSGPDSGCHTCTKCIYPYRYDHR